MAGAPGAAQRSLQTRARCNHLKGGQHDELADIEADDLAAAIPELVGARRHLPKPFQVHVLRKRAPIQRAEGNQPVAPCCLAEIPLVYPRFAWASSGCHFTFEASLNAIALRSPNCNLNCMTDFAHPLMCGSSSLFALYTHAH